MKMTIDEHKIKKDKRMKMKGKSGAKEKIK